MTLDAVLNQNLLQCQVYEFIFVSILNSVCIPVTFKILVWLRCFVSAILTYSTYCEKIHGLDSQRIFELFQGKEFLIVSLKQLAILCSPLEVLILSLWNSVFCILEDF